MMRTWGHGDDGGEDGDDGDSRDLRMMGGGWG